MKALLQSFTKFNDKVFVVYILIMIFALFNGEIFFKHSGGFFKGVVLMYLVAIVILAPKIKHHSISKNAVKYVAYFILIFAIYSVAFAVPTEHDPFSSPFAKLVWVIAIIGMSETIIRIGVLQMTGNVYFTSLFMGILHVTTYMAYLGIDNVNMALISAILISSFAFYIFYWIYRLTGDKTVEALAHGLYDYWVM